MSEKLSNKCPYCGFNYAEDADHIKRCPRCNAIREQRQKIVGEFMFDGYERGAEYTPPEGWQILERSERPFGVSVILERRK